MPMIVNLAAKVDLPDSPILQRILGSDSVVEFTNDLFPYVSAVRSKRERLHAVQYHCKYCLYKKTPDSIPFRFKAYFSSVDIILPTTNIIYLESLSAIPIDYPQAKYDVIGGQVEARIDVQTPGSYYLQAKKAFSTRNVMKFTNNDGLSNKLDKIIAILSVSYSRFNDVLKMYTLDPDDNVNVLEVLNVNQEQAKEISNLPTKWTNTEISAIGNIIILCMNKRFSSPDHAIAFINRRYTAFVSSNPSSSQFVSGINAIDPTFAMEVEAVMTNFPKLKAFIMAHIIETAEIENMPANYMHTKKLLSESMMSIFKLIDDLLTKCSPCALFVHHVIIPQIKKFLDAKAKLIETYGENWKHAKLLNPDLRSTAPDNFADLAHAAIIYASTVSTTMNAYVPPNISSGLNIPRLLSQTFKAEFLTDYQAMPQEDRDNILRFLGIDIEACQNVDPNDLFDSENYDDLKEAQINIKRRKMNPAPGTSRAPQ